MKFLILITLLLNLVFGDTIIKNVCYGKNYHKKYNFSMNEFCYYNRLYLIGYCGNGLTTIKTNFKCECINNKLIIKGGKK
jgi:hypothetical protein